MDNLMVEYQKVIDSYRPICKGKDIPLPIIERTANLMKEISNALNNGSYRNQQYIRAQLELEKRLGINDIYFIN